MIFLLEEIFGVLSVFGSFFSCLVSLEQMEKQEENMLRHDTATKLNQILPITRTKSIHTDETVKSDVELLEGGDENIEFEDTKLKNNQVAPMPNNHFDTLPKSIRRIPTKAKNENKNIKNTVMRFIDYQKQKAFSEAFSTNIYKEISLD